MKPAGSRNNNRKSSRKDLQGRNTAEGLTNGALPISRNISSKYILMLL